MATKILQILDSFGNKIYAQNDEPKEAKDGELWVDLDEDGEAVSTDASLSIAGAPADAAAVGEAVKNATIQWVNW